MPCGKVTLSLQTPSGQEAVQSLVLQAHSRPRYLNWALFILNIQHPFSNLALK